MHHLDNYQLFIVPLETNLAFPFYVFNKVPRKAFKILRKKKKKLSTTNFTLNYKEIQKAICNIHYLIISPSEPKLARATIDKAFLSKSVELYRNFLR